MSEKCEICEIIARESEKCPPTNTKISNTGKILLTLSGASFVGVLAITTPFIFPALRKICLPYVPATPKQVQNVMKLLEGRTGTTLVDLGSGDGRIVIEAAKHGVFAEGVELNPWLVWYSRSKALREGVYKQTKFTRNDLFQTNFRQYDNVVIFGVDSMMETLEKSLENNVNNECSIIACRYPFPNWTPVCTVGAGIDAVWLYKPLHFHPKS